jgi:hypothetical protein
VADDIQHAFGNRLFETSLTTRHDRPSPPTGSSSSAFFRRSATFCAGSPALQPSSLLVPRRRQYEDQQRRRLIILDLPVLRAPRSPARRQSPFVRIDPSIDDGPPIHRPAPVSSTNAHVYLPGITVDERIDNRAPTDTATS